MDKTQRILITVIIVGICALMFLVFKYYSMIRLPIEREEPKAEAVRQEETLRAEAEPRGEASGQEEALRGAAARKEEASRTKRKEDQRNKEQQKKTQHYKCMNAAHKDLQLNWDSDCQKLGLGSGCALPQPLADRWNGFYKESQERCDKQDPKSI